MTMQLIGRMKRFSFNSAYLINSNLEIYFWDLKKGITGKRVKTPVDAVHLDPADKISLFEEDEVKKNIKEVITLIKNVPRYFLPLKEKLK